MLSGNGTEMLSQDVSVPSQMAWRLKWSGDKPSGAGLKVDVVRNLSQQLFSGLEFCHARATQLRSAIVLFFVFFVLGGLHPPDPPLSQPGGLGD